MLFSCKITAYGFCVIPMIIFILLIRASIHWKIFQFEVKHFVLLLVDLVVLLLSLVFFFPFIS